MLVGVPDQEAYGTARCLSLEHARQQFHHITLLTSCGDAALPWATAIKFRLDEIHIDVDAGGHSVHHPTNTCTMTLAQGGQCEYMSKRISHFFLSVVSLNGILHNRHCHSHHILHYCNRRHIQHIRSWH